MSVTILRKVSVSGGTVLRASNNLGDVASAATARSNLAVPSLTELGNSTNGRGPLQGLVGDGTAGSSCTLASTPSGDQTIELLFDVPAANPTTEQGIVTLGGTYSASNTFSVFMSAGAAHLYIQHWGTTGGADYRAKTFLNLIGLYGGKRVHVVITVSSGTMTVRINGVQVSLSDDSGGTPPAFGTALASGLVYIGKKSASLGYFSGYLFARIYNRALSAAEVLALYESGAPSAADYNNASNTTMLGAANWVNASGFTGFSSASPDAFSATSSSAASFAQQNSPLSVVKGRKYRFSITANAGAQTVFFNGGGNNEGNTAQALSATGGTVEITAAATGTSYLTVRFGTGFTTASASYLYPLGLLLAPETNAPGNGLVWNDKSGNGAHIVLPAPGVAWALPDARANRIRGTTSTNGNQQLLAASTLLPANAQITRIRARSRSGTPSITLGTASGGAQIVASVALSTTWKDLTIALTGGIVSTADDIWVGSSTADVVETDITWEPLSF